jgi:hypothetical protein
VGADGASLPGVLLLLVAVFAETTTAAQGSRTVLAYSSSAASPQWRLAPLPVLSSEARWGLQEPPPGREPEKNAAQRPELLWAGLSAARWLRLASTWLGVLDQGKRFSLLTSYQASDGVPSWSPW